MIQLLFTVLGLEVALVVVLLFRTPLRKVAIMGLDRLKRGRGPVMVKTVTATVMAVLGSTGYSIVKVHDRSNEAGQLTPTDQVLASRHLLEASLMGYSLFLAFVIDRLHHYIRELRSLRKSMDVVSKLNRVMEEAKNGQEKEIESLKEELKTLKLQLHAKEDEVKLAEANTLVLRKQSESQEKEIEGLKEELKTLESQLHAREEEVKSTEANNLALRKQTEGLLLEYDRLLEDNQHLRSQLQSLDLKLSHSDSNKKDT